MKGNKRSGFSCWNPHPPKPRRVCEQPGCGVYVPQERLCPKHAALAASLERALARLRKPKATR